MLIVMAVWDTAENKRTEMTRRTLESLSQRVNMVKHRIVVSDNGSCEETQALYESMGEFFPLTVIKNGENIGTARAINRGWSLRRPGEHAVKMDNDCVVHYSHWADEMEEVFERDPSVGICGLKRKDLEERPDHQVEHYRSILRMLPHQPGQRWVVVEEVNHVLGTCQAYSSALLDKIGYLYQGGWKYGFDDALASLRARVAGFKTVFLPHIDIDHIDPGGNAYTQQKQVDAGQVMGQYSQIVLEYRTGKRPVYFDGGSDVREST